MAGQSGITFELLDGTQAAAHADELRALHAEVYGRDDDGSFAGRFRVLRRQPGFVLAEARHGGYLVGYACGRPLRPSTSWWRHLTTPLPVEVTTEHPGRTFALVELLVRASWRRQGIGETLHDLILAKRPEERATLTVPPAAIPAQHAFRKWGWRKVARTRDAEPGSPVSDVLTMALGPGRPARLASCPDRVAPGSLQGMDGGSADDPMVTTRLQMAQLEFEAQTRRFEEARARLQASLDRYQDGRPQRDKLRFSAFARLQARLDTMPVIEQAKGILMAQNRCGPDEAYELLRRASQRANVKVSVLAAQLVKQIDAASTGREPSEVAVIS